MSKLVDPLSLISKTFAPLYRSGAHLFLAVAGLLSIALLACSTAGGSPIVFVSDRDGNLEIYSVSPGGGDEKNLTNSSKDEVNPILAPNKKLVAFQVVDGGATSLATLSLDGKKRAQVVQGPGKHRYHRWSPDSDRLAYVVDNGGVTTVHVASIDGSESLQLTTIPGNEVGDWSRNGDSVVFSVRGGDSRGIWIRNPDGVNEDQVTQTPDYNPRWSPDTKKIAFLSTRNGNPEIYVTNADGSDQTRLTVTDSAEYDLSWSPNGQKILFVSERDGNPEIYVMNVDGSDPVRLTRNSVVDEQPVWSPNGQQIAFVSHLDGDAEIFVMNRDGSNQTRLTNNTHQDTSPSW